MKIHFSKKPTSTKISIAFGLYTQRIFAIDVKPKQNTSEEIIMSSKFQHLILASVLFSSSSWVVASQLGTTKFVENSALKTSAVSPRIYDLAKQNTEPKSRLAASPIQQALRLQKNQQQLMTQQEFKPSIDTVINKGGQSFFALQHQKFVRFIKAFIG